MTEPIPCVRCGRPAEMHHARPDNPAMGKGMGGGLEHEHVLVPLCREHHDDVHAKRLRIVLNGPIATCVSPEGEVLSVRAIRPQPLVHVFEAPDVDLAMLASQVLLLDDQGLAYVWSQARLWHELADIVEAMVAWAMYQRYGSYGERWYERAAELLAQYSGEVRKPGLLADRAAMGRALDAVGWDLERYAGVGKAVLAEVGRAEAPPLALERAEALLDAGLPAREAVRVLRAERQTERPAQDVQTSEKVGCQHVWRCALCGEVRYE